MIALIWFLVRVLIFRTTEMQGKSRWYADWKDPVHCWSDEQTWICSKNAKSVRVGPHFWHIISGCTTILI